MSADPRELEIQALADADMRADKPERRARRAYRAQAARRKAGGGFCVPRGRARVLPGGGTGLMHVALAAAARQLGTSSPTLRRWVREEGCPAIEGGRGRGKGYRVDVAAVRAWRESKVAAEGHAATLSELARLALDFFRRGREPGEMGQRLLGVPDHKAAAFLCLLLNYFSQRLTKAELRTAETDLLAALAREGLGNVHAVNDSV